MVVTNVHERSIIRGWMKIMKPHHRLSGRPRSEGARVLSYC